MLITFNKKSSVNEYFFFFCSYLDDDNEYIIGESEDKTIFQTQTKKEGKICLQKQLIIFITYITF